MTATLSLAGESAVDLLLRRADELAQSRARQKAALLDADPCCSVCCAEVSDQTAQLVKGRLLCQDCLNPKPVALPVERPARVTRPRRPRIFRSVEWSASTVDAVDDLQTMTGTCPICGRKIVADMPACARHLTTFLLKVMNGRASLEAGVQ